MGDEPCLPCKDCGKTPIRWSGRHLHAGVCSTCGNLLVLFGNAEGAIEYLRPWMPAAPNAEPTIEAMLADLHARRCNLAIFSHSNDRWYITITRWADLSPIGDGGGVTLREALIDAMTAMEAAELKEAEEKRAEMEE